MTLVGVDGAAAPDMVEMARRGGPFFWTSGDSQIYAETKRLAEFGYLHAQKEPGKTRSRTFYTLTPKGRRALQHWLRQPARFPAIQHEASFRLIANGLISDAEMVESLRGLRAEVERLEALLAEHATMLNEYPGPTRYGLLEISLARKLLQAHREWVDEVEQELGSASS
jgi:DNA-binding PadR family transcriptional regulator